jgi:superfamily II DNA or RNA helicase
VQVEECHPEGYTMSENTMKVSRNAPCPCGSGRKYKRCCLQVREGGLRSGSTKFDLEFLKTSSYEVFLEIFSSFYEKNSAELLLQRFEKTDQLSVVRSGKHIRWVLALMTPRGVISVGAQCTPQDELQQTCTCSDRRGSDLCEHAHLLLLLIWMGFHVQDLPWRLTWRHAKKTALLAKSIADQALLLESHIKRLVDVDAILLCSEYWKTCDPQEQASFEETLNKTIEPSTVSPVRERDVSADSLEFPFQKRSLDLDDFDFPFDFDEFDLNGSDLESEQEKSYLGHLLQYRFVNGMVVPIGDLVKQEDLIALDPELDPQYWFEQKKIEKKAGYRIEREPEFFHESRDILFSIVMHAQKQGIAVFLVQGQDPTKRRSALRLRQLTFSNSWNDAQWSAYLPGQLSPEAQQEQFCDGGVLLKLETQANRFLFPGFVLAPRTGCLTFHDYSRALSCLCQFFFPSSLDEDEEESSYLLCRKDHAIRKLLEEKVNPALCRMKVPAIEVKFPAPRVLDAEKKPVISFNSSSLDFRFSLDFEATILGEKKSIQSWNLPEPIEPLIIALREGIPLSQNIYERPSIPSFRNMGLCMLVVLELTSYALDQTGSDGQVLNSDEDFWNYLDLRLGGVFYDSKSNEDSANPLFSEMQDEYTSLHLRKWCLRTLAAFRLQKGVDIVLYDQVVHWQEASTIAWRLLQQLLLQIAIKTRAQCFKKIRTSAFENFMRLGVREDVCTTLLSENAVSYSIQEKSLKSLRDWISILLPLHERGYSICIDGKLLESLVSTDLQAKIEFKKPQDQHLVAVSSSAPLDWFELHPRLFFRGIEVDPLNLASWQEHGVLDHQGKLYYISEKNLPSIKRLENFWKRLKMGRGSSAFKNKQKYYQLPRSEVLELLALRSSGATFNENPEFNEICTFYDGLGKPRPPLTLPDTLPIALKPYQHIGVQWLYDLYRLRLGAILADDMGLGKTPQTIAFLELLRTENLMSHVLIVVPPSLVFNWKSEFERFAPQVSLYCFDSRNKEKLHEYLQDYPQGIVICTYGLLVEHIDFFEQLAWNIVIFDEAQNLKNIVSRRSEASRKIQAKFKICLTGTPLENHMGEFYSLLDLVVPGCLGDYGSFRDRYVNPDVVLQEDIQFLRLKTRPLVLRRTKGDILSELPEKMESTVKLNFEKRQEKIYRDIALSGNQKIKDLIEQKGASRTQLEMLAALLRLRQVCSDPAGLPGVGYSLEPPKISVLKEALAEITQKGESALVFTQFLATFHRVEKVLKKQGISVFSMSGGTSTRERERVLKRFQEETQGAVLLMTLKTGGVGLNLIKASYVFHLEPWWNPAAENQATDRAHRMGQKRSVQVFRYLMQDSVEEKIQTLKGRKQATFDALFSQEEAIQSVDKQSGSLLTQADFEYLIRG